MILILDGDRKRGEETQKRLWNLHLLSDVTTYASLRNRVPSEKITDRIDFLLLPRPDDPARPPNFFKTFRKRYGYPTVVLGGEATVFGNRDPSARSRSRVGLDGARDPSRDRETVSFARKARPVGSDRGRRPRPHRVRRPYRLRHPDPLYPRGANVSPHANPRIPHPRSDRGTLDARRPAERK